MGTGIDWMALKQEGASKSLSPDFIGKSREDRPKTFIVKRKPLYTAQGRGTQVKPLLS